jgi:hypothetical protein
MRFHHNETHREDTAASIKEQPMQILNCATCDTSPLDTPRLVDGQWYANCPGCDNRNLLEADSGNVFLPMRFRVASTTASRRQDAYRAGAAL